MTLGQLIKKYTTEHKMSLRQFATRTGLSATYIGYLIKNETPSGEPPSPTIDTYKVCAKAMGMDVDELVRLTNDDVPIGHPPAYSEATKMLFTALHGASEEEIMTAVKIINALKR